MTKVQEEWVIILHTNVLPAMKAAAPPKNAHVILCLGFSP